MKVYVVFRDVPFEFGEIHHVCATRELADKRRAEIVASRPNSTSIDEEMQVQDWDVEEE